MTNPQKYPKADTSHWYQNKYPGKRMEVNAGVFHTTEGTSLPTYGGGSIAPTFTVLPNIPRKTLKWYQHFDFDVSSRAMRNSPGGVETNTLNVVQVELVGTCDPAKSSSWDGRREGADYLFWPRAPRWALEELGAFLRWCFEKHGVPLTKRKRWLPYPESYGATSARMTPSEWLRFRGWCGHSHVPENRHGDPGNLDVDQIISFARDSGSSPGEDLPYFLSLGLTKPMEIKAGVWRSLRWDTEWFDPARLHPKNGLSFAGPEVQYSGTVRLTLSGLTPENYLLVRMVYASQGKIENSSILTKIVGTSGNTYASVPLAGRVSPDCRAKLMVALSPLLKSSATVEKAELEAQVWT